MNDVLYNKYRILSFTQISNTTDLWTYFSNSYISGYSRNCKGVKSTYPYKLNDILKATSLYKIHSIQRLSDGEIFTVGDSLEAFTYVSIDSFKISTDRCLTAISGNSYILIDRLIKKKPMKKTIELTLDKARTMYGKSLEMDELLLANFSKSELEKPQLPTKWMELSQINGFYINGENGNILSCDKCDVSFEVKDVFATEKQAKSALAMAQLSQLMKAYNGDWVPNWNNDEIVYCIYNAKNGIRNAQYQFITQFIAFKTPELRSVFLDNFENLIKEYFMID